jgi:hypothetical protein
MHMSVTGDPPPAAHQDRRGTQALVSDAVAVVSAAQAKGATLRLLGGLAIYLHSGPSHGVGPWRAYGDIDFIARHADVKVINAVFAQLGYAADEQVNTLHGRYRLVFEKPEVGRKVDVMLDVFQMCHRISLIERLGIDSPTIALADLLLTKLQIRELNRKDADDIAFLLNAHPVGDDDGESVNGAYIAALCGQDWGLHTTVSDNLAKMLDIDLPEAVDQAVLVARLHDLQDRLSTVPKSAKWRLRAKVGRRYPWYEEVEEIDR